MIRFQRPYPVISRFPYGRGSRDGWWFVAFGIPFRVRGWRIYRWLGE